QERRHARSSTAWGDRPRVMRPAGRTELNRTVGPTLTMDTGYLTVPKASSRTRTMPMFAWPWRSLMPQPETAVFLHSSWKEERKDSESVRRKRNLDCGPAQQEMWSLKTVVW